MVLAVTSFLPSRMSFTRFPDCVECVWYSPLARQVARNRVPLSSEAHLWWIDPQRVPFHYHTPAWLPENVGDVGHTLPG